VEGDPYSVTLDQIEVRHVDGRLPCAGRAALGCFQVVRATSPNGTSREFGRLTFARNYSGSILYTPKSAREVMQHECAHAILWLLGESDWADYGRGHRIQH
jgi:hypothetical protein